MKDFTLNEYKTLGAILDSTMFSKMEQDLGIMEDDPQLAFGFNKEHGNVYVAFNNDLVLYGRTGRSEVKLIYNDRSGIEHFDSETVKAVIKLLQDDPEHSDLVELLVEYDGEVEDALESFQTALRWFQEYESEEVKIRHVIRVLERRGQAVREGGTA